MCNNILLGYGVGAEHYLQTEFLRDKTFKMIDIGTGRITNKESGCQVYNLGTVLT